MPTEKRSWSINRILRSWRTHIWDYLIASTLGSAHRYPSPLGDARLRLSVEPLEDRTLLSITAITAPAFEGPTTYAAGSGPNALASLRLENGDKVLLSGNYFSNSVSVIDPTTSSTLDTLNTGSGPNGLVVGDFGSGHQDFAIANYNDNTISVFLGDGTGNFTPGATLTTGTTPANEMAAADFNADGKLDLAVANAGDGNVSVFLGNGDGTFNTATNYAAGSGSQAVVVGDFFGNGRTDLAVANANDGTVSFLENDGSGSFASPVNVSVGSSTFYYFLAAGDLNEDGKTDVILSDFSNNNLHILTNQGSSKFSVSDVSVGSGPDAIAVGDITGSGHLDIVVSNYFSNNVTELRGNGDGTFQSGVSISTGSGTGPNRVVLDDLNHDGNLDLATANQDGGNVSVFLNTAIIGTAGQALPHVILARFSDAGGPASASAYSATITWGDSSATSTGTVVYLGNDQYAVYGPGHVYSSAGSFNGTVSVDYTTTPEGAVPIPFTATIRPSNNLPTGQSSLEGDQVGFPVFLGSNLDGPITYSATGLPLGVWIDPVTGWISGTIGYGTASLAPYQVIVSVTNGSSTVSDKFSWSVDHIRLDLIDDTASTLGVETELEPHVWNPSDGPVTFAVTGLPSGLSFDPTSGVISGTPTSTGTFAVGVTATSGSFARTVSFQWSVVSLLLESPGDLGSSVGDTIEFPFAAETAATDPILWSATGLPVGLGIDAQTGIISGTIASDADLTGPYAVTVTATSGSATGTVTFNWIVDDLVVESLGDQNSLPGDQVELSTPWSLVSSGTLTWTATGLPPGLAIDSSTGIVSGTISVAASTTTPYSVTLTATVGSRVASSTFDWVIEPFAIVTQDSQFGRAGDSVTLPTAIQNPLGGTAAFNAVGLPPGLTIDAATGVISGTITGLAGVGSPFSVTVSATVAGTTRSTTFPWLVSNGRVAVTVPGTQSGAEGDTIDLSVAGVSDSGSAVSFLATGLPDGLEIDAETGAITGTLGGTAAGSYLVTVWAETALNESGLARFEWVVTPANIPPTVYPVETTESLPGSPVSLWMLGLDFNEDTLTWSASGLPAGLTLDTATGQITGTIDTAASSQTPYQVTVSASDGSDSTSVSFDWYVQPVLLGDPGDQDANEGDTVSLPLTAVTADSGATVSYAATNLPPGLSINSGTGLISGTIADLAANAGMYSVTLTATSDGYTSERTITWAVSHIIVTAPDDQANAQGDAVSVVVTGVNPSDDPLAWTATGLPDGLSIDPDSGEIGGVIATTAGQVTPYLVTVTASDATGHHGSATFQWSVNAVSLSAPGYEFNLTDDVVSLALEATDGFGGTLAFSADGLPPGLAINTSTGMISGTIESGAARVSPYAVTILATNGTQTAETTFSWVVTDLAILGPTSIDLAEGAATAVNLDIREALPVGTSVTYSASGLPSGLTIDPATGDISGTTVSGTGRPEVYRSTVVATTPTKQIAVTIDWTVTALTVTNPGTTTTGVGEWVSIPMSSSAAEGVEITYEATGLPEGLSIDPTSGVISGVISDEASPGDYPTTLTVMTDSGLVSTTFDWHVRGFSIADPGVLESHEGESVSQVIEVTNLTSAPLSWTADGLPDGLTINAATGEITGTIDEFAANAGVATVFITASDGTDTQTISFPWSIVGLSLTNAGDQTTVVGQPVSLAVGSDENPATAIYAATGLPTGLTINPTTGTITGTPTETSDASEVTVTVSNNGHTGKLVFDWTVTEVAIGTLDSQYSQAGGAVSIPLGVLTSPGATVAYDTEGLPEGVSVVNGVLVGTLPSDAGTSEPYVVTITATVGDSVIDTTFDWYVTDNVVQVTAPTSPSTRAGSTADGTVTASVPSNETLRYSAVGLPDGVYIGTDTGDFFGSVDAEVEPGTYPVTIFVQSADGHSGLTTTTWTVTSPNQAPVLPAISNQTTRDGGSVTFSAAGTDADGDGLLYSATGLPPGLTIDPNTGVITGTISEAVTSPSYAATYPVTISVSDNDATITQTFDWAVRRLELSSGTARSNAEGDTVSLEFTALASEGATVSFSATNLPPGLSIDPATGTISGTIAELASNVGVYHTVVSATDSGATATEAFDWSVTFISLTNPGKQTTLAGNPVTLSLKASAPKGILTYSATGLPSGLSVVPTTGQIRGTVDANASRALPYHVVVTASAADRTTSTAFDWTVSPMQLKNPGDQYNAIGDTIDLPIAETKPVSPAPSYSAKGLPPDLVIDPVTGRITGTIASSALAGSPYTVTITSSVLQVTTYPIPTTNSGPVDITPNPATHGLSFVEFNTGKLGEITLDGIISELTLGGVANPPDVSVAPDGTRFVTGWDSNVVLIIKPDNTIITVPLGSYGSTGRPNGTVLDGNGNLWFTTFEGDSVDRLSYDHSSGAVSVSVYPVGTGRLPCDIVLDPNGQSVWYTNFASGSLGHLLFSDLSHPQELATGSLANPLGLAFGSDGNIYVAEYGSGKLAQLSSNGSILTRFDLGSGSVPYGVTQGPDGNIWVAESGTSEVDCVTPAGVVTTVALPAGSSPTGIAAIPATPSDAGSVWVATIGSGTITKIANASITFDWPVTDNTVTITNPGDQTTDANESVALPIVATNPADLPLTYAATGLPPGLSQDPSTGDIFGTISSPIRGTYHVRLWADDGAGDTGTATFDWTVTGSDRAPVVTNPGAQTGSVGVAVSLPIVTLDLDGDTIDLLPETWARRYESL